MLPLYHPVAAAAAAAVAADGMIEHGASPLRKAIRMEYLVAGDAETCSCDWWSSAAVVHRLVHREQEMTPYHKPIRTPG
uniref:Putative secreted protein n=1 Tax=Anopheles darlingi TaxID=43151 RepID=A0A2M4D4F8_ANODA